MTAVWTGPAARQENAPKRLVDGRLARAVQQSCIDIDITIVQGGDFECPYLRSKIASYLREHGAPERLDHLAAHALLAYGKARRIVPWVFNEAGRRREILPVGRIRFDDLDAIADAAAGGHGLAWLPSWLVAARLASGQLVEVLASSRGPGFDIHAVWPLGRYLPMRIRIVIDELVRRVPALLAAP